MTYFTSVALVDIQQSLGTEIVIFVVTLLSAFLLGNFSKHSPFEKPIKSQYGKCCTQNSSQANGARRCVEKSRCGKQVPQAAVPGCQPNKGNDPSKIISCIINGMQDQHNLRFANRVLALYEDLKNGLAVSGMSMSEAAMNAKHPAIDFYTVLVHCAIRSGNFSMVDPIMDDMVEYGISRPLAFYESIMKQLAGQKQYHLALVVHDRLADDGLSPSAVTCSCLIGFASEVGQFDRAVGFFEQLCKIDTPSIRACMMVLRIHSKLQDWPASVQTLREMHRRGAALDCLVLNVVLATGVAVDMIEEAGKLITEVDGYVKPVSDVVSFNTLVKGYAQRGDLDGVKETINRMQQRGLVPNAITFNTAMDAAVRAGRNEDARELLYKMRDAKLKPDKFTCSIFVKGLTKNPDAQHVQDSLDLMNEVKDGLGDALGSTLYHTILEAAVNTSVSKTGLAAKTFAQMRRHHVTPTPVAQRLLVQTLSMAA